MDIVLQSIADVLQRLDRIELVLESLSKQRATKDWYSIAEVAQILGKANWTVREWARTGRIRAEKRRCGRSEASEWMISHEELERYRNEGLLPGPSYRHVR